MATKTYVDKAMLASGTAGYEDGGAVDVEVEIVLPGMLGEDDLPEDDSGFEDNLAEQVDDDFLTQLSQDLVQAVEDDQHARSDWEQMLADGMQYLGVNPQKRSVPWQGASNVVHPVITEAVVRFQSESITEMFPAAGPVRTQVVGRVTREREEAATRVADEMNYQLTHRMPEYRGEHERMLWGLAVAGSAFKKVYFDKRRARAVSLYVPAEDVIIPYGVSDIRFAARVTHVMRKSEADIHRLMDEGFYADVKLDAPAQGVMEGKTEIADEKDRESGVSDAFDTRYVLYEIQCEVNLKGFEDDGDLPLPYIVTIEKASGKVLSIYRNWVEGDDGRVPVSHFVHYQYIPATGAYGFGLLHLVGNSAAAATSTLRQLIDAGTLANLQGGFKTRSMRVRGDNTPIAPGEWRDVDVPGGTIKDNIVPLPYKEPSQTLLALMQGVVSDAQRLASTTDMKVSDMSAQAPVGTTLALIERSLKILSAVQSRLHNTMREELALIAAIVRDDLDAEYEGYEPKDAGERVPARVADFSMTSILPVSDPNASTMAQRIVQYQAVFQMAQQAPQIYNLPRLHRMMMEVMGVTDAARIVELEEDLKPVDPVSENMAVLQMKPVKAFIFQNHEAHIAVHMAAMQDPQIMKTVGQNPQAQAMMAAMQAHIAEHVAYRYREQMEQALGVQLPAPDTVLDPETAASLATLTAQAARKILGEHTDAERAAQHAQAQADPMVQLQQREMGVKEGELEVKKQRLALDAAAAADAQKSKDEQSEKRLVLDAYKAGADVAIKKAAIETDMQKEGVKVGVDVAKSQAQMAAAMEREGFKAGVQLASKPDSGESDASVRQDGAGPQHTD